MIVFSHQLLNLALVDPRIRLDIRYATNQNFCNTVLYPVAACFLHRDTALALRRVQDKLAEQGLFLKVFDGYRPLAVQQIMWDLVQDENYVMNPAKGKGRHTRGTAVDLTLVDEHGNELEMPSSFDDFTSKAHRINPSHSEQARRNMLLLEHAMTTEGWCSTEHYFEGWPLEWWHYDLKGWNDDARYPSLNIPLQTLAQQGMEIMP